MAVAPNPASAPSRRLSAQVARGWSSEDVLIWEDGAVDDEVQRRVAANEAALRKVNETIKRGQWPGEDGKLGVRCECARLGCDQVIELTTAEYEQVRAHPRRFVLVHGHEVPAEDTLVVSGEGWVVVEKCDSAGEVAEATDPRE
jgi:hypothetical protein